MFYALCTFIVLVFGFSAAEEVPLPPITLCKRNSVNFDDCLKTAIEEAWPQFIKGLPEFDFPPLEPINYESGTAIYEGGVIHAVVNVTNFIGEGLPQTHFLAVKSHFSDQIFHLEIDTQIPKITGSGDIVGRGNVAGFPINGKGPFNLSMEDLETKWIIKGPVANDIWTVEDFYAAPSIKKVRIYFDLIRGNKELNDLAVNVVNEFWPSLYRIVIPAAAKAWNPWLCDLTNRFFSKVSFTKIFS
ncbi:uncharacterized protein [Linepithema humile]|uniref:uncharacterized protein isoform X2 n=1 Tax=Linepithema humile TaxID=83485 RepID=UPI00351E222F